MKEDFLDEESTNAEDAQLQQDYDEEKNLSVSVEV